MSSNGQQLRMQHLIKAVQKSLKVLPLFQCSLIHGTNKAADCSWKSKTKTWVTSPCSVGQFFNAEHSEQRELIFLMLWYNKMQTADLQFWKWHFIPPGQITSILRKEKTIHDKETIPHLQWSYRSFELQVLSSAKISTKKTNGSTVRNNKIKGRQLHMFLVLIHPYSKNSICRWQPQKAVC